MTDKFDPLGQSPKLREIGDRLLHEKDRCPKGCMECATERQRVVGLSLTLPPETLDVLAQRAADLVKASISANGSPWMTRKEAAAYMSVPVSRLEKDRRVPCHRWDGRVLYCRAELDAFVRSLDNTRP